jgi:hypothetical protein
MACNKALALINSSHPIPCLAVASLAGLFAIGSGIAWDRSLLIFFVVLLQQISVGLSDGGRALARQTPYSLKESHIELSPGGTTLIG